MRISFVLPFYKKAKAFRQMLPLTDVFRSERVELVLVLDEPSDEPLVLETVREFSGIKFRVIVNDWDHAWRPPCIAINVGIRFARADHVAILSPETALLLPRPTYLFELLEQDWRSMYGGMLWNIPDIEAHDEPRLIHEKILTTEAICRPSDSGCGFLLVQRFALERIRGFDEHWPAWGRDDDDVRCRLMRLGLMFIQDPNIKAFHAWHEQTTGRELKFHLPNKAAVALYDQEESWGKSFGRLAYDYQ